MRGRLVSTSQLPSAASCKEQLILDHLPLVRPIATSIRAKIPVHVESEDLIHDGVCGLVETGQRFDESRKVPYTPNTEFAALFWTGCGVWIQLPETIVQK